MKKPVVNLNQVDGNVFAIAGAVVRALRTAKQREAASTVYDKLNSCRSYQEALVMFDEFVTFTWDAEDEGVDDGDYESPIEDNEVAPIDDYNYVGSRYHY
jgi:hypothetical protein